MYSNMPWQIFSGFNVLSCIFLQETITRAYLAHCVLTTLCVQFNLIHNMTLINNVIFSNEYEAIHDRNIDTISPLSNAAIRKQGCHLYSIQMVLGNRLCVRKMKSTRYFKSYRGRCKSNYSKAMIGVTSFETLGNEVLSSINIITHT